MMPRKGNLLMGPSALGMGPLIIRGLQKRSTFRLCMELHRVIGCLMATGARRFAEEQVLPSLLRRGGALGIHLAVKPKLRCRGEVQECLDLCHEMHLAASFEHVDPLLCRDHRIAIEVGRALLELRKILHTL